MLLTESEQEHELDTGRPHFSFRGVLHKHIHTHARARALTKDRRGGSAISARYAAKSTRKLAIDADHTAVSIHGSLGPERIHVQLLPTARRTSVVGTEEAALTGLLAQRGEGSVSVFRTTGLQRLGIVKVRV